MNNIYIICAMYDIDNTDPDNPVATELPGWHVNSTSPIKGAEHYLVTPTTPRVVFAGVETIFYSFPDEAKFNEFMPDEGEEV